MCSNSLPLHVLRRFPRPCRICVPTVNLCPAHALITAFTTDYISGNGISASILTAIPSLPEGPLVFLRGPRGICAVFGDSPGIPDRPGGSVSPVEWSVRGNTILAVSNVYFIHAEQRKEDTPALLHNVCVFCSVHLVE